MACSSSIDDVTAPAPRGLPPLEDAHVLTIHGREAILAHAPVLEAFAAATSQFAAMHGLQYTLDHQYARRKTPHLVCLLTTPEAALAPESLLGCALFFEYRFAGWNTGLVATGDSSGLRTVLGPAEQRAKIAALAAAAMLRRARIVLASFRQPTSSLAAVAPPAGFAGLWTARTREVRDHLHLCPTYAATLATLGKRTRTHLRYYRKRTQAELACEFLPDARPFLDGKHLAALNAASLDPIDAATFALQYRTTADLPGGFVCGLRAADGRWLSLAGGWRQHTTTLVQWQSNAAGFEHLSLGTAFRAFLLEHETALGTTKLCFHNGTSHSMHHAFPAEHVVDLVLRRPSRLVSFVVRLVPALARTSTTLATRGNFLAEVLQSPGLDWHAPPNRRAII